MKPRLFFLKRVVGRNYDSMETKVFFVIVDSDISKAYPLNFVCKLPMVDGLCNGHSAFKKLFGEDGIPLAKKLLSKALISENDSEIKSEIRNRLKLLNQKTAIQAKRVPVRLQKNLPKFQLADAR